MKKILCLSIALCALTTLSAQTNCKGVSKKTGDSCRSAFVSKKTGYCRIHDPASIHCAKDGCGMIVKEKGQLCRVHQKKQ
jgi:hypothetical protein